MRNSKEYLNIVILGQGRDFMKVAVADPGIQNSQIYAGHSGSPDLRMVRVRPILVRG